MKKSQKPWAYLLALVFICYMGASVYFQSFDPRTWQLKAVPPPAEEPPTGWAGGTFTITVAGRDSLDSSGSLTAGTDFTSSIYAFRQGGWVFLGASSGSGTNIESLPQDDGYIWVLCEEASTKYWYSDKVTTQSMNYYCKGYQWADADKDTTKEFLYKFSLWNIPEPASGYPSRTFYPYFIKEGGQGTAANLVQWDTQPTDVENLGTGPDNVYVSWATKTSAQKRGACVYKVAVKFNSSDTTKFTVKKVNIPGVGYVDGSLFTEDLDTVNSYATYTYQFGTDFDTASYWTVAGGANNKFDNTVWIEFNLSSGSIGVTLYIYELDYARTGVSDSDEVVFAYTT